MPHYADKQAIHEHSMLSARMDTAKHIIHKKENLAYKGKNIGIAILDTGISPVEDFLLPYNRIVAFRDFVGNKITPYDDNGHGTHVTGIVCGNGYASGGKYQGIAPQSNIISIKILDKYGQGNSAQAITGLRWIMDNAMKYNIRVVNLSIGTNDRKINIPLMEAVNKLWARGITVVAAAGNPDSRRNFQPSPAISPRIITVGAWEDRRFFYQAQNTPIFFRRNIIPLPDIWAPGENIISTLSPDYDFALQNRDTTKIVEKYYIKMSGTSMATPMVSGAAALLLEKYPHLSPDQIKRRIILSAQYGNAQTEKGLLNISACLA